MQQVSHRSKTIKKREKKQAEEGENISSDEDNEKAPTPLLSKFEKWPEYIEVTFRPQVLQAASLLSEYNNYALQNVFDQKTRELIHLKSFPVTIQIYLIPELNVLTVALGGEHSID